MTIRFLQRIVTGRRFKLSLFFLFSCYAALAHDVIMELEKMPGTEKAILYLKVGYEHILPLGLDHILFVVSLFLVSPRVKPVLWQSLAFTVAHSITLGLAVYDVITPSARIIEPVIAVSILYIAIENIFSPRVKPSRLVIVFCFGLIHGLGFAGALSEIGLSRDSFLSSLIMFNIGIELGQLTVVLAIWLLLTRWVGHKPYFRSRIVIPLSALLAIVAAYWTYERIFLS